MQVTSSIPIVMIGVGNPVESGFVADYRKPGGNVTGSAFLPNELARKLLQLLKEAAPHLQSVAVFANPTNEGYAPFVKVLRSEELRTRLGDLGLETVASTPGEFDRLLRREYERWGRVVREGKVAVP